VQAALWGIVVAALAHIAEEYFGGWLNWARRYIPGVTLAQFAIVNAVFVGGCVAAAVIGTSNLVLSLSIASLVFINALLHIASALAMKRYTPGLASAVVFYLPLAAYAYYDAARTQQLLLAEGAWAALLGAAWMSVPLVFQALRLGLVQRGPVGNFSRSPSLPWRLMRFLNRRLMPKTRPEVRLSGLVLLLTTTGRKSGLPRQTRLQYEKEEGVIYVASARGQQADWFRNILANPRVEVQFEGQSLRGLAEPITDSTRIAVFLELRLKRHPLMIRLMLLSHGLFRTDRVHLERLAAQLALVAIRFQTDAA